jgi:fucose permease
VSVIPPAARRARWAIAAMFLVNGFIMGSWAPQIPLLLPRHQITEFTLGLLILMLGVGAVGAMAFAGGLIGRFGSLAVLRVFALSASVTLAMVVLAPGLPTVTLAMVVMGALIGCMDVSMNANAVEVERSLGRAIMSSSHGFWSLGGFIGGGLGGVVIAAVGAEAHAVLVSAACLAAVLVTLPFLRGDAPAPAQPAEGKPRKSFLPRDPAIYVIGLMALFCMVPEGAVLDWAALYVTKELGADIEASGLAFAFFSGTMAVMRFMGDAVRNRFGAVQTLRVSAVIGAAGLMGGALAPTETVAIAAFAVAGLGVANTVPIALSAAGNHPGLSAGVGISTVAMMGYSGILVAPSTIGFVAEAIGFRVTYGVLALVLLVVAAMAARCAAADGRPAGEALGQAA